MSEKKKMTVTCHKCGRVWESEFELMDATECPKCGTHGQITTANSHSIRVAGGRIAFVPAP